GAGAQVLLQGLLRRTEVHGPDPPLLALERVEADVGRDPVEPGADRGPTLEALAAAPGADEGVLDRVLGVEGRTEHAVAVGSQLGPVLLQLPEGGRGECRLLHREDSRRRAACRGTVTPA